MSFEVKEKDLLGRIGKLKTKSGTVETPLLYPVINPSIQLISPQRLKDEFGFEAIITNAYILWKRYGDRVIEEGLHKFLNFNGVVMTDSGAYQILVYGGVEVSQAQIVNYEERIGTDIATILDIPTGWHVPKEQAQKTVAETLKRAKAFFKLKTRQDMLWVGPVQGGRHLDLVAKSARAMGKLPFQIHALGSPTEVMESYRYDVLIDMIMTAKMNLPLERPLHLFGAGHPHMMALTVALGCDIFDSAAYALYAREGRYMTENGTWRLTEMDYFPCQCPRCATSTPKAVMEMTKKEKEVFLAEHNLHVCVAELKRIKQAIRDGRLWEHVEMRAHAHPALLNALKRTKNYEGFIEKHSPTVKQSGFFFFDSVGLARPEVVHYRERLSTRLKPPSKAQVLVLVPQGKEKPFHRSEDFKDVRKAINRLGEKNQERVYVCFYAAPFGIIPLELDEVYPLSQHETSMPMDCEVSNYVAKQVSEYVKRSNYKTVVLIHDPETWGTTIKNQCQSACKKEGVHFHFLTVKAQSTKEFLANLNTILKQNLSEST
ncbi:MAG TPA: tRNA guanosine(15) transglycosylase TgtA [Candidatus Nanoarchaeia archaeon]|nr:tRNA guanosine(15) transglycosylase TgtA [Candidatus Nanoarchaeia archaeon]